MLTFNLDPDFVASYKTVTPPFGFGGVGEVTYRRTYSRVKADGTKEEWFETVARVVNGIYTIQKDFILKNHLGWDEERGQASAKEMYERIFNMKFTPPGRGLWVMGTDIIHEKQLGMAANNCAFVSTSFMDSEDPTFPFCFLMDASMLGTGVGFDLKGKDKVNVYAPINKTKKFVVPDSREGWVESLKVLLESYLLPGHGVVEFDYSEVRPYGTPIKTFGGTASGPDPLIELHEFVRETLNKNVGSGITERTIIDIQNAIGRAVVAGNVRRTAEIVFGPPTKEYMELKNYEVNPDRAGIGWTSNNSIFAEIGMDYTAAAQATAHNGEPGYEWLENARAYGRMCEAPNWKDRAAMGGNPCLEQTLEHGEVCCLVETYPTKHDSLEDYLLTLKYAYLYAKTVTLLKTNWSQTNRIVWKNRRIGTSMSGIAMFVEERGLHTLKQWCEAGYDEIQKLDEKYSNWFGISRSVKTTSIKPSGTVSLLAGVTPGVHYPRDRYYIRRIRIGADSDLIEPLRNAGYHVEPVIIDAVTGETDDRTMVVEFPVDGGMDRTIRDVSIWEKMSLAAFMQKYWADNQVSCTIDFDPETEGDDVKRVLDYFQYDMKGISFLPMRDFDFPQLPYQGITQVEYEERSAGLQPIEFTAVGEESKMELYCDGDSCVMK